MLRGALVDLRERRDEDEPVLYAIAADLDTWEERDPAPPAPLTRAEFHERFVSPPSPGTCRFVIEAEGRVVGRCDLFGEDALARHAEIGIALVADARGRGFGTDAVRVLADFAFTRRNLHRLHLTVMATNTVAVAAYRRAGFVEEGRLREHAWVRGRFVDEVRMGLLRADWAAARA